MHRPTQRHDALRQRVFAGRERRNAQRRRAAVARKGGRRVIAIGAGLAMVAGVLTVTQLASSALEDNEAGLGNAACEESTVVVEDVAGSEDVELHIEEDADGVTHYHYRKKRKPGKGGGKQTAEPTAAPTTEPSSPGDCDDDGGSGGGDDDGDGGGNGGPGGGDGSGGGDSGNGGNGGGNGGGGNGGGSGSQAGIVPPGGEDGDNNGLDVLGRDCSESDLPLHTGFQSEDAHCVNAQMGEVSAVENNPTLLITDAPNWVQVNEPFSITVSTRNLVRDRFLGAAAGGYYLESSFLNEDGIQRGHFHVACTLLSDGNVAPDPLALLEPGFFGAVEDGGGGAGASEVSVDIPGLDTPGLYRCMAWAGDGSHRVPMMSFARQHIAVDVVRVMVTDGPVPESGEE